MALRTQCNPGFSAALWSPGPDKRTAERKLAKCVCVWRGSPPKKQIQQSKTKGCRTCGVRPLGQSYSPSSEMVWGLRDRVLA